MMSTRFMANVSSFLTSVSRSPHPSPNSSANVTDIETVSKQVLRLLEEHGAITLEETARILHLPSETMSEVTSYLTKLEMAKVSDSPDGLKIDLTDYARRALQYITLS